MSKSKARVPSAVTKSTEGVTPLAEQAETPSVSGGSETWDTDFVSVRFVDPGIADPDDTVKTLSSTNTVLHNITVDGAFAVVKSLDAVNPISCRGAIKSVQFGRRKVR